MKATIVIVSFLMGGWMFVDGAWSVVFGKYIGPDKPGPWADIVSAVGFDPMRFGLVFMAFGIDWIVGGIGVIRNRRWGLYLTGIIAFLSLWYFPIGTLLSILILALIPFFKPAPPETR